MQLLFLTDQNCMMYKSMSGISCVLIPRGCECDGLVMSRVCSDDEWSCGFTQKLTQIPSLNKYTSSDITCVCVTWTWCWEVAHHRSQTDTRCWWPAAPELHLPPEDPQVSAERSTVSAVKEIQHYRRVSCDQVCGQDCDPAMEWTKYPNHTVAQLINVQIKTCL